MACLNIKDNDEKCLMWCLLASLHLTNHNPQRVNNYSQYQDELNMTGITFPASLRDIAQIERQNNLSINVYGIEKEIVFPLAISSSQSNHHIDLLYINSDEVGHFVLIKNLSRLVSKQISSYNGKKYIYKFCLHACTTNEILIDHMKKCSLHNAQRVKVPEKGNEKLYLKKNRKSVTATLCNIRRFRIAVTKTSFCMSRRRKVMD